MFQEEDDAVRETEYMVAVEAVNIAGTGGPATATITVPSGKSKDLNTQLYLPFSAGLPGAVSNIRVDIVEDNLNFIWVAPTINADTVILYSVEVLLGGVDGQQVYTMMASGTSLSATRGDIQEAGDIVRTSDTQYTVVIVTRNGRGDSETTSETFTFPAGE